MRHRFSYQWMVVLLSAVSLFFAGCGSTAPSRFYVLSPVSETNRPTDVEIERGRTMIGIGPVTLPPYLDRPQIVTTVGVNELSLGDFNKWAEPLKNNFSRVLSENLSAMLSGEPISIFPWQDSSPLDYRIEVEVIRFDGRLGQNTNLIAWWTVLDDKNKKLILARRASIIEPTAAPTYEALVLAQSHAVEAFSREVADTVKKICSK